MVMDVWQEAWGPLPLDFEGMNLACQVLCISNTLATHELGLSGPVQVALTPKFNVEGSALHKCVWRVWRVWHLTKTVWHLTKT